VSALCISIPCPLSPRAEPVDTKMAAEPSSMTLDRHFPKRKNRLSVAVPSACRLGGSLLKSPKPSGTPANSSPARAAADGANLSAALTALKVSLKRDLESFAPPTPAVSPSHARGGAKRARFDFDVDELSDAQDENARRSPASPNVKKAMLAVSSSLKRELEKRRRRDKERSQLPRKRQQLGYLAIIGAFHRAALERKSSVKLQPLDLVIEASK
jgi:hypothetical protein